jgi:hypothetical protein
MDRKILPSTRKPPSIDQMLFQDAITYAKRLGVRDFDSLEVDILEMGEGPGYQARVRSPELRESTSFTRQYGSVPAKLFYDKSA